MGRVLRRNFRPSFSAAAVPKAGDDTAFFAVTVTATWPATLAPNARRSISVPYATMVGTAVQADFNARSGSASLSPPRAPATTRSTTIPVSTRADSPVERDEHFTVALTERDNYRVMDHGIVTIRDRSATVSISDVTVDEGVAAVLTVGVAGRVSGPARVSYYTRQRTATAGLDYRDVTPRPGQVVDIPAGENPTATISIHTYGDVLTDEGDDPDTLTPDWRGERPDLDWVIHQLWRPRLPAEATCKRQAADLQAFSCHHVTLRA